MTDTQKPKKSSRSGGTAALSAPRDLSQLPVREMEQEQKKKLAGVDLPFTMLVLLLQAVGLIALFSASYADAYYYMDGNSFHYAIRQGIFAAVGLAAMYVISRMNYHKFHYFALPLMVFSIALLATRKLIPSIWVEHNGAMRWINLKVTEFQPSEIAKFAVILCFASLISVYGPKKMHTLRYGTMPFIGMIGAICGLMAFQPHLSGMIIVAGIGVVMMFIGGTNIFWLGLGGGAGAAVLVYLMMTMEHAQQRLKVWLDPFIDPRGDGWQGVQSFLAIGTGGVWGLGLGQSRQKHLFLPEPANDFIFSVWCEEMGLVGALLVIVLFAALILRGYYIAMRAGDKFGTLLAAGVTTQIALQTIINMCVVTGLMPVTGASLPFFSAGGTSLMVLLAEVGVVLSVSRRIPAPKQG